MASEEQKARAYDLVTTRNPDVVNAPELTIQIPPEQKAERWDRRMAKQRRRTGTSGSFVVGKVWPGHRDYEPQEHAHG